jgi:hypothetical protein
VMMDPSDGIDWKGWYIFLNYCSFSCYFIFIMIFSPKPYDESTKIVNKNQEHTREFHLS